MSLFPLGGSRPMLTAFSAAISSSTSRRRSLPKNISSPTKKVGLPKAPRSTAASVLFISRCLTSWRLGGGDQRVGIEPGFGERGADHFRIVHFLRRFPHVMEHGIGIGAQNARHLRRHRHAHQRQRVHREIRIELEIA